MAMTNVEAIEIFDRALELEEQGRHEEAWALKCTIPLSPGRCQAAKEVYGIDFVKNSGLNFDNGFVAFGEDWLDYEETFSPEKYDRRNWKETPEGY